MVRVLDLLDRHKLPVTVAANAGACAKYPYLVDQFRARGYEFAAHGAFATRILSSQMSEAEERAAIADSLDTIERLTGTRPRGWIGQDYGEFDDHAPAPLAEAGLRYLADWGNDDQPYMLNTTPPLVSIPNQAEWDDVQMIWHRKVQSSVWRDTALEAFAQLHADGADSGTVFGLHIHPWLTGQPHRIGYLEAIVEKIAAASDVWRTTAGGSPITSPPHRVPQAGHRTCFEYPRLPHDQVSVATGRMRCAMNRFQPVVRKVAQAIAIALCCAVPCRGPPRRSTR